MYKIWLDPQVKKYVFCFKNCSDLSLFQLCGWSQKSLKRINLSGRNFSQRTQMASEFQEWNWKSSDHDKVQ